VKAGHEADEVRGERTTALVSAARSLQSRASSVMAAALMITLGVSALTWYYAHALASPAHTRQSAQATAASRAQGEMALPALGPVESPIAVPPLAGAPLADPPLPEAPVATIASGNETTELARAEPGVSAPRTPAQLARERRLAGRVFTRESGLPTGPAPGGAPDAAAALSARTATGGDSQREEAATAESLATLLRARVTETVAAQLLPDTRFLLPKGAFIDCTLETAIDSTLPGMTTCVTAADTFGADGSVVLLERGTKLVGETRGQVQQGQARVFVVWTQARTPAGVSVPLDSPGTDELGRAGLPGQVERHFWQRFGAAMLVSLVDGAVQAGVQSSSRSSGTIVYAPATSQNVLTEVLKDTLQIPPTVSKRNGDRIEVLVARDVDFRPVYELAATGR
jgi:type IV secretion system protein VirB10